MAKKIGAYDGLLLGAFLGLILTTPSIATWAFDLIDSIVPLTWDWFGTYTISILGAVAGAIIGWVVDRSR